MDFLAGNLVLQIIILVVGVGLAVWAGIRAVRDRKAKAAAKKRGGGTSSRNSGLRR